MTKQAKYTPTPWKQFGRELTFGSEMWAFGECYQSPKQGDPEANAAFIVKACNSYEQLVTSLKALILVICPDGKVNSLAPYFREPVRKSLQVFKQAEGK